MITPLIWTSVLPAGQQSPCPRCNHRGLTVSLLCSPQRVEENNLFNFYFLPKSIYSKVVWTLLPPTFGPVMKNQQCYGIFAFVPNWFVPNQFSLLTMHKLWKFDLITMLLTSNQFEVHKLLSIAPRDKKLTLMHKHLYMFCTYQLKQLCDTMILMLSYCKQVSLVSLLYTRHFIMRKTLYFCEKSERPETNLFPTELFH